VPEEAGIFMTSADHPDREDCMKYYDAYVGSNPHQGEELELNYATHECYLTNEKALTKKGERKLEVSEILGNALFVIPKPIIMFLNVR